MDLVEFFKNETNIITVQSGQILFRAGDPPVSTMFVLIKGSVDVVIGDMIVENASPGALLGEMGLIDPGARSATVKARTESRLAPIDMERFHTLIQQTPEFARHVLKIVVERLRHMNVRLLEMQATMKKL
jgi:CRP/FNR family transcriptional regulator, cyclic AMP receptor protein